MRQVMPFVWSIYGVGIVVFFMACCSQAFESITPDGEYESAVSGFEALLLGWITLLGFFPGWLANPATLAAGVALYKNGFKAAAFFGAFAILCASTHLLICSNHLLIGAWLWLVSVVIVWLSTLIAFGSSFIWTSQLDTTLVGAPMSMLRFHCRQRIDDEQTHSDFVRLDSRDLLSGRMRRASSEVVFRTIQTASRSCCQQDRRQPCWSIVIRRRSPFAACTDRCCRSAAS